MVKIIREIVKYFKWNDNEILAYQNCGMWQKQCFEGNIMLNAYITKEELSKSDALGTPLQIQKNSKVNQE